MTDTSPAVTGNERDILAWLLAESYWILNKVRHGYPGSLVIMSQIHGIAGHRNLAEELQIDEFDWQDFCSGEIPIWNMHVERIAKHLGVTLDDLYAREKTPMALAAAAANS